MLKVLPRSVLWLFAASFVVVACGDDDDDSTGDTGGSANKGGAASTGGAKPSGGTAPTTGGRATGGTAQTTGGTASTTGGEAPTTGGEAPTTGGAAPTTGGAAPTTGGAAPTTGGAAPTTGGSVTVIGGGGAGGSEGGGGAGGSEGGIGGEPSGGVGGEGGVPSTGGDGAGGEGGATIIPDVLDNGNFEAWNPGTNPPPIGWTVVATPADAAYQRYNEGSAHQSGSTATYGLLAFYNAAAYTATVSQVVSPLPNGTYTFTVWHMGQGYATDSQYVFAKGYDKDNPDAIIKLNTTASESAYELLTLPPIPVTSGRVEVGVYTSGTAGAWSNFDDATLTVAQ